MTERQQSLCYEDLCELSRVFNACCDLASGRHFRINEALKDALGRANQFRPNEVIHLRNAVSKRKRTL